MIGLPFHCFNTKVLLLMNLKKSLTSLMSLMSKMYKSKYEIHGDHVSSRYCVSQLELYLAKHGLPIYFPELWSYHEVKETVAPYRKACCVMAYWLMGI